MRRRLSLIIVITGALLVGCARPPGDYIAASSVSKNGFLRHGSELREAHDQEVKIWGFVDHGNLYGNDGVRKILGEWWSGDGPSPTTWRFNLKAREHDAAGNSFEVRVPNDTGRDELLEVFLADARKQRPTKVFVKGRIFTFDAPTNIRLLAGLYLELRSSRDVLLELPEAK